MSKSSRDALVRSPIPFYVGSNGEIVPRARSAKDELAERHFQRLADEHARRLGISRREFVQSTCGTALALLVMNQVYGCRYAVDSRAALDSGACQALAGDEFIFDVQTHHVNPQGSWRHGVWEFAFDGFPQAGCGETDKMVCYDREHYVRELFVNSDTDVAILSAVPAQEPDQPLGRQEMSETKGIIDALKGSPRLLTHGLVLPQIGQAELDGMQNLKETLGIAAWKSYTQFGDWRFTDDVGLAFVEKALALGTDIICTHKGLSLFGLDPALASAADIGPVARMYPKMRFVVYHSGYDTQIPEGPYDPTSPKGVDTLIRTMADAGLGPTSNVYAELGSTWRALMTSPIEAAHVIGKLLKCFGEDRILWGTDSIWYGSPQDQIDAFRAFTIPEDLQEKHGYPALTPAIKAKIFGLNAAALYGIDPAATRCAIQSDAIAARKSELDRPAQRFRDYGPRTRREFFAFLKTRDGLPG
jgi:predicted TIM-barrel fold metal-dependent hydrolase